MGLDRLGRPSWDATCEDRLAYLQRTIKFANLTQPVLAQMKGPGTAWVKLVYAAGDAAAGDTSAIHAAEVEAGVIQFRANPTGTIRTMLRIMVPGVVIELAGCKLDIITQRVGSRLPQTALTASVGRRIDEVVDAKAFKGALGGETIRRATGMHWGTRFVLDLPLVGTNADDLRAISAAPRPRSS